MEKDLKLAERLYRLPYSKNDNPNGWIEITTQCNQRCPGCYRGCNLEGSVGVHEPLEKIIKEIDLLVEIRNCQVISISGGEPLLHPDLTEVVRYVSHKGLTPLLHTNGVLLTREKLIELKKAGLISVIVRVDSIMHEKKTHSEKELNTKREAFAEIFRSIGGINLGFISVVNKLNVSEIGDAVSWFSSNVKNGDFYTLIPAREIIFEEGHKTDPSAWVSLEDLHTVLKRTVNGFTFASYLGSQARNIGYKWLQAAWVIKGDKILTILSAKSIELFQMYQHLKKGRYTYFMNEGPNHITTFSILLYSVFLKDFRKAILKVLLYAFTSPHIIFKRNRIQVISITMPPEKINGQIDLCDACPDAILYNGELVPSCGLEEIKKYGSLILNR